jgi:hypothetical protein
MKKSATFVAALLAVATMGFGPAAQAATGSIKDKAGDAPAKLDLTRLKVTNTSAAVVITVKVRGLSKRDTQFFAYNIYGPTTSYAGTSHRSTKGAVEDEWYLRRSDGIVVPTDCATQTSWNLKRSAIRTTIPRSCVTEAGTLRINASLGSGRANSSDQADTTKKVKVSQD